MRRFAHYLLNVVTVLALLACVATSALWLHDAHRTSRVGYERHQPVRETGRVLRQWWFIRSSAGLLELYHGTQTVPSDGTFAGESSWYSKPSASVQEPWRGESLSAFNRRGFGFEIVDDPKNYLAKHWKVVCADWFVAGLTGGLFLVRAYFWRRARKPRLPGQCLRCGYDLRATPDRCPECGTPGPAPEEPA